MASASVRTIREPLVAVAAPTAPSAGMPGWPGTRARSIARLAAFASHIIIIAGVGLRIASSHMLRALESITGIIESESTTSTRPAPAARLGWRLEARRKTGPPRIRMAVPIAPISRA